MRQCVARRVVVGVLWSQNSWRIVWRARSVGWYCNLPYSISEAEHSILEVVLGLYSLMGRVERTDAAPRNTTERASNLYKPT